MFALQFLFPTGRYHATPWGRHVNEAAVAWPPEPYRILRALIAAYWRKGGREKFAEVRLAQLIDRLAEAPPSFYLPDAVHAHSRHFMPAPVKKTLVFDAFARFDPDDPIVAVWPELTLADDEFALAQHLARSLAYLGRAEGWVDADALTDYDVLKVNCQPHRDLHATTFEASGKRVKLHTLTPLRAADWTAQRKYHLEHSTTRPGTKAHRNFEDTLPERLADALAVETSQIQVAGWSAPPAAQRILYVAPELGTLPRRRITRSSRHDTMNDQPMPTVARYVLAGRPRPPVTETIKIAEIMRAAAMSRFGYDDKKRRLAPPIISGKKCDGNRLRSGAHQHAFFLPEDADGDGQIDHVIIYAEGGLDGTTRAKLDLITKLYHQKNRETEQGRRDWRLALEGFGDRDSFIDSRLLGEGHEWTSATPYLMPWHRKKRFGVPEMIRRACVIRNLPEPETIELQPAGSTAGGFTVLQFHRFRSRRGLTQPDTHGAFVTLKFRQPVRGPLAFGFSCHFGLGLFRRSD